MIKLSVSDALAKMLHREEVRWAEHHARFLAEMRVQELRESVGGWRAGVGQTIPIRKPPRYADA